MRYTDRDCLAALIRVASAQRKHGIDMGVAYVKGDLAEFAERLGVPVRDWRTQTQEQRSLSLDHSPSGGVRPVEFHGNSSGAFTPRWWRAEAGLGPGSTKRAEFVLITSAAECALNEAFTSYERRVRLR